MNGSHGSKPRNGTAKASRSPPGMIGSAAKPVQLRLYIAGETPKSVAALQNLRRICDEHIYGQYQIQIIDLLEHPQKAREDQIVAIPTVVKNLPTPIRKLIGDMSSAERVMIGLSLHAGLSRSL